MEQLALPYTAGGMQKWYCHFVKWLGNFSESHTDTYNTTQQFHTYEFIQVK